MDIPSLGSLAWHESWAGFGEGAFTLMAKLLGLNGVGMNYIARQLHAPGQMSFITGPSARETPLALRLSRASVPAQLGSTFVHLAGATTFRYCKTCLNGGYQAVLNQLDVFERCPIHDEPLLDCCSCCGKFGPDFGWSSYERHLPSFTCRHCNSPLAGGADLDKRPDAWVLPDSLTKIESFHKWAEVATKRVELARPDSWITCAPRPARDRRAALTRVLSDLEPCTDEPYFRQIDIDLLPPVRMRASGVRFCDFGYAQVAAETLPPVAFSSWTWADWRKATRDLMVPVELSVSVELHAAYIWRCQFEEPALIACGCPNYPRIRSGILFESWMEILDAGGRLVLNEQLCKMLARAAWRAALRVARAWRAEIETLSAGQNFIYLDRAWLLRMGRWDLNGASPLGFALKKTSSDFDDLFLFVA